MTPISRNSIVNVFDLDTYFPDASNTVRSYLQTYNYVEIDTSTVVKAVYHEDNIPGLKKLFQTCVDQFNTTPPSLVKSLLTTSFNLLMKKAKDQELRQAINAQYESVLGLKEKMDTVNRHKRKRIDEDSSEEMLETPKKKEPRLPENEKQITQYKEFTHGDKSLGRAVSSSYLIAKMKQENNWPHNAPISEMSSTNQNLMKAVQEMYPQINKNDAFSLLSAYDFNFNLILDAQSCGEINHLLNPEENESELISSKDEISREKQSIEQVLEEMELVFNEKD